MNRPALALVCCLLLAGCAAPVAPSPTPADDRLGEENGYAADDSLSVDASDGLNESELDAVVARTMARVELLRGLEFEETVPVEVISRAEYLNGSSRDTTVDTPAERAREQRYEAAMLVGEDRTVGGAFDEIYGDSVLGYYSPSADRIVLVSGNDSPTVDRATLAHELVHALQDQRLSLLGGADGPDAAMAQTGVVEGDANYVEARYEERCGDEWECLDRPESSASSLDDRNFGLYLTVYAPYSEGPAFVHRTRQRGGVDAVNDLYTRPPRSSEQLIHPRDYPADRPERVVVPDRSTAAYDRAGSGSSVGEATLFAMLWQQRAIDRESLRENPGPYSEYNYSAPPSDGWAGDKLVPYFGAEGDGYVLKTRWETERDARQFDRAYRGMLTERMNATTQDEGVYRVSDGPFEDAFRVTREGKTVRIVNAPTVEAVDEVRQSD